MERRLFVLGIVGAVSVLSLLSCAASKHRTLPPEEVIRRTVVSNASLESVAYSLISTFQSTAASGTLIGTGTLRHGGSTWSFRGSLSYAESREGSLRRLNVSGLFISPFPGTAYVQMQGLSGMLADAFPPSLKDAVGQWRLIGSGTGSTASTSSEAIDPTAVDALVSSIKIVKNLGIQKGTDGVHEYHFHVRTNSGSSPAFKGELFIDAKRFNLRRASWSMGQGPLDVAREFTVQFSQFGSAQGLPSYIRSGERISFDAILNTISASSLLPTLSLSSDTGKDND